jgi:lipopolysaccharide transport system ATP-binding protein
MTAAIIVEGVGKRFLHRDADRPRTVRRFLEGGWRKMRAKRDFWALRDVSFEVDAGEMLGVIGSNGSGKSTLLRILGGVMRADEGRVRTAHEVNGLLDLSAGMHPDLTGRENAICSGVLAGLSRREIGTTMDEVIEFAELAEFIDEPLRGYSAGMKLRLGFAVAAQTRPRILLIDEVLAVGDLAFQRKCLDRISRFRADGCAIVLISHDLSQVESTCDRALWLNDGGVIALGETQAVARRYEADMLQRGRGGADRAGTGEPEVRFGRLENRITRVRLLGPDRKETASIAAGDSLTIQVWTQTAIPMSELMFSITVANDQGMDIIDVTTEHGPVDLGKRAGEAMLELELGRLDLAAGQYSLSMGIYEKNWAFAYDRHVHSHPFAVHGRESWCPVCPPHRWSAG